MSAGETRTALITGANRGIGLAVAEALARAGLRVVLGCRSLQAAKEAAAKLVAAGHDALPLSLDVSEPSSVTAVLAELTHGGLQIDVLVNNAGVYREGSVLDGPLQNMRDSLNVHFFGPLLLCRGLIPGMVRRGYGRVVNVSSGYGALSRGLPGDAAYSLSKAALNALTLKLSQETSGDVKVNAACPGWVKTRMGGPEAERSVEEGADTIVWLSTLPPSGPTGGFFRDRKAMSW